MRSVVDEFPALAFWILMNYQVDPYPKDLDKTDPKLQIIQAHGLSTIPEKNIQFYYENILIATSFYIKERI